MASVIGDVGPLVRKAGVIALAAGFKRGRFRAIEQGPQDAGAAGTAEPVGLARGRHEIINVEAGRGLAALLVVLFHATTYYFTTPEYWTAPALGGFFGFGHAGVEFFFVLSGYLIYAIHRRDFGRPERAASFAKKRFARMYPFYWLCLAFTIATLVTVPSVGQAKNLYPANILGSILFVGTSPQDAVMFITWTLFHEVLFYALIGVTIVRKRLGLTLLAIWGAASLLSPLVDRHPVYVVAFINILFLFGIATCHLLDRFARAPRLILLGGAGLFVLTGLDDVYWNIAPRELQIAGFGLGSAMMLGAAIQLEQVRGWRAPWLLRLLGQASYAIYLTHMMIMPVAAKAMGKLGLVNRLMPEVAFAILVVAAVAGGIVAHILVERPASNFVRRAIGLMPWRTAAAPSV